MVLFVDLFIKAILSADIKASKGENLNDAGH